MPCCFYIFIVVSELTKHNIRDKVGLLEVAGVSGDWMESNWEMAESCMGVVRHRDTGITNSENKN